MSADPHNAAPLRTTLIIPTFGRDQVLADTLGQVLNLDPAPDEVLVIDQTPAHTPEVGAFLRQLQEAGRIRLLRQPPGVMGALNRALIESRGEILLICDDDVELPPGWVGAHLKNFADPTVTVVTGTVEDRRGPESRVPGKSTGQWRTAPALLHYRTFPFDHPQRVESLGVFKGGNWSVRRAALLRAGGFDDDFIGTAMGWEPELATRLIAAGGRILYDPEAYLVHLGAPAGGCRVDRRWPEWVISYPETYWVVRHFTGRRFGHELIRHVRRFVLRRDNVFRPWRLPWALGAYGYSIARAMARARRKRRLIRTHGRAFEGELARQWDGPTERRPK